MEKSRKPKIRFKGYNDDWEQRKLGELASSFEYGLNAASKSYDGINKYIRITDIDDETRTFLDTDLTSPDCDLSLSENYLLKDGDILFARTGASVGKTFIYKAFNGVVYYAGFLIRARLKENCSPQFVFYNTLTKEYEKFIRVTSQRSGQPGVNAHEYATFELLLPKYDEQCEIGKFFTNLDHLITLHQRKLDKLINVKKSMLEKMFPKQGSTVPEIRFNGFTQAWEQRKFRDIGSVSMCRRIFKEQTSLSGDVPFYKIGTFGAEPDAFISKKLFEEYKLKYPYPNKGDILISASGSIGKIVEYTGKNEYFQDSNIVWLKHEDYIKNSFLKCYYSIVKWSGIEGSTIKRLYNENILNTSISVPSEMEQEQLGVFFENIELLITLHQRLNASYLGI